MTDNQSYQKRDFGKQHPYLLPRAIDVIEKSVMAVAKNKIARGEERKITVTDFGAGPGRYLAVYKQLADRLKEYGFSLNYIAYDAFEKQLHDFEKEKLLKPAASSPRNRKAYSKSDNSLPDIGQAPEQGIEGPTYKSGNLTVQLIVGDKTNNLENIKQLLPKETDIWLSLFAPLNHIRGHDTRVGILNIANEITNGPIIVSGPCKKPDIPEVELTPEERSSLEIGDMLYEPKGSAGSRNFLHIFTADSLAKDFISAGVGEVALQANNIAEEHDLANNISDSPPNPIWHKRLKIRDIAPLPSNTQTHLKRLEDSEACRNLGIVKINGRKLDKSAESALLTLQGSNALCLIATGLSPRAKEKGLTLDDCLVTEPLGKDRC